MIDVCVALPTLTAVAFHGDPCERRKRLPNVPAKGIDFERHWICDHRLHDDPAAYAPRKWNADLVEGNFEAAVLSPCEGAWTDNKAVAVSRQQGPAAFGHGPAVAVAAIESDIHADVVFGIG